MFQPMCGIEDECPECGVSWRVLRESLIKDYDPEDDNQVITKNILTNCPKCYEWALAEKLSRTGGNL